MSQEKELIEKGIKELETTLELFYQQKNLEALNGFESVLGKVSSAVDSVFQYKESHDDFQFDEEKLTGVLTEAMGALEENDFILMADVLQYDFVEYMNELVEQME